MKTIPESTEKWSEHVNIREAFVFCKFQRNAENLCSVEKSKKRAFVFLFFCFFQVSRREFSDLSFSPRIVFRAFVFFFRERILAENCQFQWNSFFDPFPKELNSRREFVHDRYMK